MNRHRDWGRDGALWLGRRVIDGMLTTRLKEIWPKLVVLSEGGEFSKGGPRMLQISPRIEHIRLVSVGARVAVGVMAGGSDLVMHADFGDSAPGIEQAFRVAHDEGGFAFERGRDSPQLAGFGDVDNLAAFDFGTGGQLFDGKVPAAGILAFAVLIKAIRQGRAADKPDGERSSLTTERRVGPGNELGEVVDKGRASGHQPGPSPYPNPLFGSPAHRSVPGHRAHSHRLRPLAVGPVD